MTYYPKYLQTYPNMDTTFPFHLSLNRLESGYPAHRHNFLEFSYVVEGYGAETINGVKHKMAPGTFTFVLPYQVHELFSDPGSRMVLYNCMFSMDLLMGHGAEGEFVQLLSDWDQLMAYTQFNGREQDVMNQLLIDMYREYKGSERWRKTILQAKLKETLVRFDRYRSREGILQNEIMKNAKSASTIWRIIHYIHSNYQEDVTLSSLSRIFSLSTSRISELIKQTTGQTFVHFLHDLRIRHASSLLVSTDMSVTEIAHEVGYGSYKTFSRIFRDSKGAVPRDYRKEKQK